MRIIIPPKCVRACVSVSVSVLRERDCSVAKVDKICWCPERSVCVSGRESNKDVGMNQSQSQSQSQNQNHNQQTLWPRRGGGRWLRSLRTRRRRTAANY